ncbi:MAG: gliding motility lipoprotein GldH [Crocinitomicaceae bacterium]|nr:gliding motility lipoprotein GldH [Crocinitomicaceae bacterium]MBT6028770.1 gliding motility lipoprotein GldH [Crocinitomicaceae bacterium]
MQNDKTKTNRLGLTVVIGVILSSVIACTGKQSYYEEYIAIPDQKWNQSNIPFFEFEIKDTLQRYDLYFNIRHAKTYEWKNLWVFLKFELPMGMYDLDTLEFVLQDSQGRWLGKGSGNMRDGSYLFKTKTRFPFLGTYKASFEQAMRIESIEDITDIGFRIQEVNE